MSVCPLKRVIGDYREGEVSASSKKIPKEKQ